MAIHINKLIDPDDATNFEEFLSLTGTIVKPKAEIEVWRRKGVGGVGMRHLGTKGQEFTITGTNLVQTFQLAETALDRFTSLIGLSRALSMQSIDYGNFFITDINLSGPVVPAPVACAVLPAQYSAGGVAGNYVLMSVKFTLVGSD